MYRLAFLTVRVTDFRIHGFSYFQNQKLVLLLADKCKKKMKTINSYFIIQKNMEEFSNDSHLNFNYDHLTGDY
jgi:hypothetical protein